MVEADAFLATILEHPDDDAPRLVFADWLEEHGELDRAEFVRVQIELARAPTEPHRRSFLKRREKELLHLHRKEWLRPLHDRLQTIRNQTMAPAGRGFFQLFPNILGPRVFTFPAGLLAHDESEIAPAGEAMVAILSQLFDPIHIKMPLDMIAPCQFRRGFVESISLVASDFVRFAETLFAQAPLRELQTNNGTLDNGFPAQRTFLDLFACKHLKKVAQLKLQGVLAGELMDAFVQCPYVAELRSLDLQQVTIPSEQFEQLLAAQNLPNVCELNLASRQLGNDAVAILARNANWKNVRVLNLSQSALSDEAILALSSPDTVLRNLTNLDLSSNSISAAGVVFLAHSSLAGQLQELNLGDNHLDDSWVESFSRWPVRILGRRSLSPWVQQLLDSRLAGSLKRLNLGGHKLPREDRLALQEHFGQRLTWEI